MTSALFLEGPQTWYYSISFVQSLTTMCLFHLCGSFQYRNLPLLTAVNFAMQLFYRGNFRLRVCEDAPLSPTPIWQRSNHLALIPISNPDRH